MRSDAALRLAFFVVFVAPAVPAAHTAEPERIVGERVVPETVPPQIHCVAP